ncbi:MAG: radical SAM protein [Gemmatimonadaceae bacterium]
MNVVDRAKRHLRIMRTMHEDLPSPPFLILFINSLCNMKCEHCFYWRSLNGKDDLTRDELFALSRSLGRIENLNLSGGEPFLRKEFGEVCRQFIQHNETREIYVPTNGYFTDRTVAAVREVLKETDLRLFAIELSLDGMPEFHDEFRVARNAFKKAMETYDALAEIQKEDPRLRVHCISTATGVNMDEIRRLTTYLYERCPQMDHHNLAIIRGDRKNPTLEGPMLQQYEDLYEYIRRLWSPRETARYGSSVEPMLQWAKVKTVREQRQVVPCGAGKMSAVVYANGDVSLCETHKPIGNLRQKTFPEIWGSPEAQQLRRSIANKECYCTTEVFMWSSIVYQPVQLVRAATAGKVWREATPLGAGERLEVSIDPETRMPASASVPAGAAAE